MLNKDDIIKLVVELHESLKHFKDKYEISYAALQKGQNEGIANIEKTKKDRAPKFISEVDKQIRALKIVIKREYDKHVELLKKTDNALRSTGELVVYAKSSDSLVGTIKESLEKLIPFLSVIYKDSDYIIRRLTVSQGYTLAKQQELVEAGLSYDPVKELLKSEISDMIPNLGLPKTSMGAFNLARGQSTIGSTDGLGGKLATLKERQKQNWKGETVLDKIRKEKNKSEITDFLSNATPESLSSMTSGMKKKIAGYMGGVEIGRKAKIEKGDPHIESATERLIFDKTGKTREELISGDFDFPAPAKPIDAGIGGSIGGGKGSTGGGGGKGSTGGGGGGGKGSTGGGGGNKRGASSPTVNMSLPPILEVLRQQRGGTAEQSMYPNIFSPIKSPTQSQQNISSVLQEASPVNKEVAKKIRKSAPANVTPTPTTASGGKGGAKIVSLGGGGKGGGTGGGVTGGGGGTGGTGDSTKKALGGGPITDVRLVDITTSAIKQLEDLLIKVLKQSNITASKKLPASTSKGPKAATPGGTTPTTSSGAKIVPFNNTPTTPSGLTVIPGGLGQSPTPGGTTPTTSSGGTIGTSFTVGQTVIPGGTTPTTSSGAKIIPFNNTTPTPGGLTVIPGGLNQSATPGGTTPPPAKGSTTKQPKLPKDVLDPFRKRLLKIFKEGEEELTFLYAKTDSFIGWIPGFNSAILDARKKGLETLAEGYKAFDKAYVDSNGVKGSAFRGMMASIKAMIKISPMTVIFAGITSAFIGILKAANRLNNKIKEISAELGTSNMQSYEFFKNAMSAQTQYDNMYASLRDVRDVQKGILGDSGILLQVNDKALASIADNAKNIGVSTEGAGAFVEALRTKGATDVEAANLAAASLELADKSKFIMPQSVMEDIAQNVEFSSKYFSNINKDSKSAQKHLVDTNLQVKALGLNFQKAAKMTQHLLSFEQSIVGEVEASVALGRHVNIGKARELLLQDDIGGAMQQMMDTMGGYDEFQNMDFAKRQLMANAVGLEVSELEKSLYLRDKIGITNEEALNAAMKNSDYLDKVAGKDVELYKIEAKKVLAAERFNTAVEKVGVAFKSSLLPILEAIIPLVDHMAWAINLVAAGVKYSVGGLASAFSFITGGFVSNKRKDENTASPAEMASGGVMMSVMGASIIGLLKSKLGGKIGDVVGKARGGLDQVTGTLGSKSNPMYVHIVGGGVGESGGGIEGILDSAGGGGKKGGRASFFKRMFASKDVLDRAKSIQKIRDARNMSTKTGAFSKIGQYISNVKPANMLKLGGLLAVASAGYDVYNRKQQGQSTAQAVAGTAGGVGGGLLGATGGAILGAALGTAIAGPLGTVVGAALGGIGGIVGGFAGYNAGSNVVDSQFKPNEFKTQPFMYAGMNGMSGGGGISTSLNKPTAKGIPVETSMVDTTPTTLKPNFSNPFNTIPNYGTTSMSRNSAIVNTTSKSVSASAMLQNTINNEKQKTDDALIKEAQEQTKLMQEMIKRLNQPALAFFNDEGRRQVKSTLRKESSS